MRLSKKYDYFDRTVYNIDKTDPTKRDHMLKRSASEIGNKAANLQELMSVCPDNVPAFCPLNEALVKSHLDRYAPVWRTLWTDFQTLQSDDTSDIRASAKHILQSLRELILNTFQNHTLDDAELNTFLDEMKQQNVMLMVRSTGEEDTVDVANPGGNESIAAVLPDSASVSSAMGQVIASYFSEKSLKQRLLSSQNSITKETFTPVLLQKMIGEPLSGVQYSQGIIRSGVMYTSEGITCIQVAPGHGELVVNSKGLFDTFSVTRENVVYSEVAKKQYRLVPSKDGLGLKENPADLQVSASISQATALKLAQLGREIEKHYKRPMDVEFIYDAKQDVISIVQARPIPTGKTSIILPSSVPPAKMPTLSKDIKEGRIEQCKIQVITSAGFAAKIITRCDEMLLCNTIEQALTQYLDQNNSPVKAVIVQAMAPATAHEAAQFNAMGIPVVQINNLNAVKTWLNNPNQTLMIDPQRNQILNCTSIIENTSQAERELKELGYLAEGLFTHPVSPLSIRPFFPQKVTGKSAEALGDLIRQRPFKTMLSMHKKIRPVKLEQNVYAQLLKNIEQLDGVDEKSQNEEILSNLNAIRYILYRLYTAKDNITNQPLIPPSHALLFPHAMVLCEEIEGSILKYSSTNQLEEHLKLVSNLKSIVSSPGNSSVFSSSVLQAMQERKAQKKAEEHIAMGDFTGEQSEFLTQFLKLNELAFNATSRDVWTKFVTECIRTPEHTQQMASVFKFYVTHQLESDLINHDLGALLSKPAKDFDAVLKMLYDSCQASSKEFEELQLDQNMNTILRWEQRISEWSDPDKFEALWTAYQADLLPMMTKLDFKDQHFLQTSFSPVTQRVLLTCISSLTDVMDKTIKSLKGSTEYTSTQKDILIQRFSMLLHPYHQLMQQCVSAVPDNMFFKWYAKVFDYKKDANQHKEYMLSNIKEILERPKHQSNELTSSGKISIDACIIGSSTNFFEQFVEKSKYITLEDIFSLIHQNILMAVATIRKSVIEIPLAALPDEIQPFITNLSAMDGLQLLSIEPYDQLLKLKYNFPMQNHSARFDVEYDKNHQKINVYAHIFAKNWSHRMYILEKTLLYDEMLGYCAFKTAPSYNAQTEYFEHVWTLPVQHAAMFTEYFSKKLSSLDSGLQFPLAMYSEYKDTNLLNKLIEYERLDLLKPISWVQQNIRCKLDLNDNNFSHVLKVFHSCDDNNIKSFLLERIEKDNINRQDLIDLFKTKIEPDKNIEKKEEMSPLFDAAFKGNIQDVKLCLKQATLPWEPFIDSQQSLMERFKDNTNANTRLIKIIKKRLLAGDDVSHIKITPQQIAYIMGHEELVSLFDNFEKQTEVSQKNKTGGGSCNIM